MMLLLLIFALSSIILVYAIISQKIMTGQLIFTGSWLASATLLIGFPESLSYLSGKSTIIIILAHFAFFLGGLVAHISLKSTFQADKSTLILDVTTFSALKLLFFILISFGLVGSWYLMKATSALEAILTNDIYHLRDRVMGGKFEIPIIARVWSNLLYPASLIGAVNYSICDNKGRRWLFVLLPILGAVLMSLSSGGRGVILIIGLIMFWAIIIYRNHDIKCRTTWKNYIGLLVIAAVLISYVLYIANIRGKYEGYSSGSSVITYIAGCIPSFSAWLDMKYIPILNADFSNIAFIREFSAIIGNSVVRTIDNDIVYVPFPFNVFTSLAEHIISFGILGALILSFGLGIWSAKLESGTPTLCKYALRTCIYVYLSYSLFADVSFFIVGWWLSIVVIPFGIPIMKLFMRMKMPKTYKLN